MAKGKWIGGFIGWMAGGPLGALAGYLLGSLFDNMLDGVNNPNNSGTWQSSSYEDYNTAYQQAYRQRQMQGDRNSFLFSLLVLSSYIIKADGKAMHSEMELVRQMLRQNFGASAVQQGNEILNRLFEEQKRELAVRARHNFGFEHKPKDPALEWIKAGKGLPPIESLQADSPGIYRG